MRSIYIYDCEVFAYDWVMVAKHIESGRYTIIHNQPDVLRAFIENANPLLGGFNVKHYDGYILKGILADFTPQEVKGINDYIIGGGNGWDYDIPYSGIKFDQFDLMDDCQMGLSLKAIEAHLGMDIEESEVDFNIDRPLTKEELDLTIHYCKHDVDATEKLYEIRKPYLENKISIGAKKNISAEESMYMTNAKLTAAYLDAVPHNWSDERKYKPPECILWEYIPKEVTDFFKRMYDETLTDEQVFKDAKLDIMVGDCPVTIGYGGIHGAIPQYREASTDTRKIRNKDVASYYPHQMTLNGFCSRNIPDPKIYADTIETRVKAKKAGDKVTANALKLVLEVLGSSIKNPLNSTKGVIRKDC